MPKRMVTGFAFEHDEVKFLEKPVGGLASEITLVATAGSGSYSPPSGAARWMRLEGGVSSQQSAPENGAGNDDYSATGTIDLVYIPGAFVLDDFLASGEATWLYYWNYEDSGTFAMALIAVYSGSGTFNLRLLSKAGTGSEATIATGTTDYDADEIIYWRVKMDGTDVVLHARQNNSDLSGGTEEINTSFAKKFKGKTFFATVNTSALGDARAASEAAYYDVAGVIEADAVTDRPGAAWAVLLLQPGGDGSNQDYGDQADCTGTAGTYTDIILHPTTQQIIETLYLCKLGGSAGIQDMTLADYTPSGTMVGLEMLEWAKANVAAKTVATKTRIYDASNVDEQSRTNMSYDDFRVQRRFFSKQPDASSEWSALANLNAIGVSVRSLNTNGANDEFAAFVPQIYEIDDDGEAAAANAFSRGLVVG